MISIFTPTYNRGHLLPRLYQSLLKQNNKNFEWIIVDDGSEDDTKSIVSKWINDKKINIRYYYQQNQGKQIAHNLGVKKSAGELFTCVDSDDVLTEDAVDKILEINKKIKANKNCVGMVGLKVLQDGTPVGTYMPKNIAFTTLYDLYNKHKYRGDALLVYKTNIIKQHEFPKIPGEKFIPETYIYDQIDQKGELAIIKEGLYVCEYLADGYTSNIRKITANNPNGYKLWAEQRLNITKGIKQTYIITAKYILACILANDKGYFKKSKNKIMTILAFPCAMYAYITKYKNIKKEDKKNE